MAIRLTARGLVKVDRVDDGVQLPSRSSDLFVVMRERQRRGSEWNGEEFTEPREKRAPVRPPARSRA
jgi:hypothetical protein